MNIDKVAPKTYEYKIQHMRSQSKETGFDRLKSRRSSMEKVEEANTKLPKIPKGSHSRDNSLKDRREKRNVRSLSKVPSLPEVKGVAKSQAAFI